MKYLFLIMLINLIFVKTSAQLNIKVDSVRKVEISSETGAFYPVLSNSGNLLCYSSYANKGLFLYNMLIKTTKEISPVDKICKNIVFSQDDNVIYFTQKPVAGEGGFVLQSYNVKNDELSVVNDVVEDAKSWWEEFLALFDDTPEEPSLNTDALKNGFCDYPFVKLSKGKIFYVDNDGEKLIDPVNVQYYLYPSLSPDSKKICAYAVGKGAFVCNVDGSNLKMIDGLEAPVWISDSLIVGMVTVDDGHNVTQSSITVCNINTLELQTLLPENQKGMYPSFSPETNKIACHTPNGEIYLINITLNSKHSTN